MSRLQVIHSALAWIVPASLIVLSTFGARSTQTIDSASVVHWSGSAYAVSLKPSILGVFRVDDDSASHPRSSTLQLFEDEHELGPPHSVHADIASRGHGRYSHWDGTLIFSTSDNSDPAQNGRRYSIKAAWLLSWLVTAPIVGAAIWPRRKTLYAAGRRALRSPGSKIAGRVLIPLTMSFISVVVFVGLGELYFRVTRPFWATSWPTKFSPDVGWTLEPGASFRFTNHLDYWTEAHVNSQGFIDREPAANGPDTCRVAIIGDSFVEAVQVALQEKVQIILEHDAAATLPELHVAVSAYGYSGTGQLNQIPFYDRFARKLNPRLVVLVFVWNDFANNSALLESVRNGWHPLHPPRPFARRRQPGGPFEPISIDPDWQRYLLPSEPEPTATWVDRAHKTLRASSWFYDWFFILLDLKVRAGLLPAGYQEFDADMRARLAWLRLQPEFHAELDDWHIPPEGPVNLDATFWESTLPNVFGEALEETEFAFSEFRCRADADGARLLILATSSLTKADIPGDPGYGHRQLARLTEIANRQGIEVLDQFAEVERQGIDPRRLSFQHDGHWTTVGHRVAADQLLDYLTRHPEICSNNHVER